MERQSSLALMKGGDRGQFYLCGVAAINQFRCVQTCVRWLAISWVVMRSAIDEVIMTLGFYVVVCGFHFVSTVEKLCHNSLSFLSPPGGLGLAFLAVPVFLC